MQGAVTTATRANKRKGTGQDQNFMFKMSPKKTRKLFLIADRFQLKLQLSLLIKHSINYSKKVCKITAR